MGKIFIVPKFLRKENYSGVYKISFDDSWFYIGGSVNVRNRFVQWKTKLIAGVNKNTQIKEVFASCNKIEFEVLEKTDSYKEREDFYIKKYWGNVLLLNKCPNSYNNVGVLYPKRSARNTIVNKVAMFNLNWELVEVFDYITDAALKISTDPKLISSFLKGKCQYVKGYKFKKIDANGNYIEPYPFISKKPPLKPKKVRQMVTPSKPVIKYSVDGVELERFSSVGMAARSIGVDKGNFKRKINKSKRSYYKGFIFKYATLLDNVVSNV